MKFSRANGKTQELYRGLRSMAKDSFPKKCPKCGKEYATVEDFFYETQSTWSESGLKQGLSDDDRTIVEVFRNCDCGSTLMEVFQERRDASPLGIERRRLFGHLMEIVMNQARIETTVARNEIIKILRGDQSDILAAHGIAGSEQRKA
jgi:hypothetical protein